MRGASLSGWQLGGDSAAELEAACFPILCRVLRVRQRTGHPAVTLIDQGGLLGIGPSVKVTCRYQPIMIILYASKMTTVASAIQAESL